MPLGSTGCSCFVQKFGEGGRDYFHQISQHSTLYDAKKTDKQYDYCLRHGAQKITIATFFHYAKLAGCEVVSEQTKAATTFLSQQKRTKANKADAVKVAVEFGHVKKEVAEQIATQVFDENKSVEAKDQDISQVEQLEMFLSTFNFRFNEVTRMLEYPDGRELKERELNDIWRAASKAHDFKVHFSDVERVLSSSFTEAYNPIHDFFEQGKPEKKGLIKELSDCIPTDTGLQGTNFYPEAVEMFLRKWLVGIVQSAFGQHSPLMLVLMGEQQNTGKTEFFRRLLPEQFKPYFMQSTLDQGKDDEINLCKNLLVLVDEYDSRTATDEKKMKRLLSQQDFTVRKPYGKSSERLDRLAVLCATSNDTEILTDPTGNRRYICVNVLGRMDFEKYNSIDKSELMLEAYAYYLEGERTDLTEKEIEILTECQEGYNNESLEAGLIKTYFIQPEHAPGAFSQQMTTTEIKVLMEHHSQQKGLSLRKIGAELKAMGYLQKAVKRDGMPLKCYTLVQRRE